MVTKRSTNFHRGQGGNKLKIGEDLIIKVDGNPLYIIGRLFKRKSIWRKQLIQIEQTGSKQNPERDQITFEMKERLGGHTHPMPMGKYRVVNYAYFTGLGGKRWGDNFEIVA